MRVFLTVIGFVAALCVLDAFAFEGHYTQAAWRSAHYRAEQFNYEIKYWLRRSGLRVSL